MTTGTIGKKRKKNGFTQIANSMFEDDRLSWKAKGILGYLLSRPNNWKINKTDLYRRAIDGKESLQSGLNELKELGYLHIYRNQIENGQFDGWVWEYDDVPFELETLENRTPGNQQEIGDNDTKTRTSGNTIVGLAYDRETRSYNNTDFNNTDLNNTKAKENNNKKINLPAIESEFEQIWSLYPKKLGKQKAFQHFKKARKIKKIPYEVIENGLYRYIRYLEQQGTDEQFIMHGSTWFGQEKWQDEYILTGIKQKPKDIGEYMRQKYGNGGQTYEPHGNGEIINDHPQIVSDFFQGF